MSAGQPVAPIADVALALRRWLSGSASYRGVGGGPRKRKKTTKVYFMVTCIGVLFGCSGRKIDGSGLPGGFIIYQGHLFALKGHLG